MIDTLCNPVIWSIVSALIVVSYVFYLIVISGRTRHAGLPAFILFILLLGILLHVGIIYDISDDDKSWFSIIGISIISSLEMFLGSSRIFDNGFQEFLFKACNIGWLIALTTVYLLAVITSTFLIVSFFFKRVESKIWLWWNSPSAIWNRNKANLNAHIFFGLNNHSIELIQDLSNRISEATTSKSNINIDFNKRIILVEYPRKEDSDYDASVFEKMHHLFSNNKRHDSLSNIKSLIRLKSRIPLYEVLGQSVFEEIDLKRMREWIQDENNILYLVSDNEQENVACLEKLHLAGVKCKHIYCHACIEGHNEALEEYYRNNEVHVTFVDSSFLAIQSLTKDPNYQSVLPIRCVNLHTTDVVVDDKGKKISQNSGYIDSQSFNSVVLGFGETGQYALAFLYEYGAFVNEQREKVPFTCHIFDERVFDISHGFETGHPGYDFNQEIIWHKEKVKSKEFWDCFSKVSDINYVFICLGNDSLNLDVAYDISEFLKSANPGGKYRIMIQIKNSAEKNLNLFDDIRKKSPEHIGRFGLSNEIWTYQNISNSLLNEQAKLYHDRYERHRLGLSKDDSYDSDWESRETEIYSSKTSLGNRRKRIRQRSQDYANCLHRSSKLYLIGSLSVMEKDLYKNAILDLYDSTISTKDSKQSQSLFLNEKDCFDNTTPSCSLPDFIKKITTDESDCDYCCEKHYAEYKIQCKNSDGVIIGVFDSIPALASFIEKEEPKHYKIGITEEEKKRLREVRLNELRLEIHRNGGLPVSTESRMWEKIPISVTPFQEFVWKKLEYLAIYEHIRWEASHIARGYKLGETTNDITKVHDCIRDYFEIDGLTQHYDWLVVKTSLDF